MWIPCLFSPPALHLLVGAADSPHLRHLLPAGGGGDRAGLRRVPRAGGDDCQAQRHQQGGAGTATPAVASLSIESDLFNFKIVLFVHYFILRYFYAEVLHIITF